jgi:hypothetical protein
MAGHHVRQGALGGKCVAARGVEVIGRLDVALGLRLLLKCVLLLLLLLIRADMS